ncbi:MAG: ATP-binding cassette domain-containing protein [Planctomycetota bacterium]
MNTTREALLAATWPHERAAEALELLARAAKLGPRELASSEPATEDPSTLAERLDAAALELDVELTPVEIPYAQSAALFASGAPALIGLEGGRLAAIVRGGKRVTLLASDGSRVRFDAEDLRAQWTAPLERELDLRVVPVLDRAGLPSASRARARRALLSEHLSAVPVGNAWLVSLPPGRPMLAQARRAKLPVLALGIALAGLGASALGLASWIPFGRGALEGDLEPAWLLCWALLLASALPLRWLEGWLQSHFGVRFGVLLRRRLMAGAARLDPQAVRGEGAGALLGRVLESEALEALLLGGGFLFLGGTIDVVLASSVLANGPAPVRMLALLGVWLTVAAVIAVRHLRRAQAAAGARLAVTRDLVERMVGQRTRLVQEPEERWHEKEDRLLAEYVERATKLDSSTLALIAFVSGGWLISGAIVVGIVFASGAARPIDLALGIGALLVGQQALARLCGGWIQFASCAVAWRQVAPVYHAATQLEDTGLPRSALRPADDVRDVALDGALLEARGVSFRHPSRERTVLAGVDLTVREGDRVLVEGPSGGGKSTLASLLIGWRTPTAGLVAWRGLDKKSHGAVRWRRHVSAAPQFHENHVFTGTLAFNLLLAARDSRASEAELEARALEIAEELGLGGVLARMPSGLRQILGETGWQLSHGEKSRLFIARALLSGAPLVVLDESLAALDPDTARQVLECVNRRARSLVVIAHP